MANRSDNGGSRKLGYIVSQYPATNHTFILHEIRTLRRRGFDIHVVSIRQADRPVASLSREEAEEYAQTYSVLGAGAWHALAVHTKVLVCSPVAYVTAFLYALRLAGSNVPRVVRYAGYFAEAVVAGNFLTKRGVRHAHTHFSSTVTLMMSRLFPIAFSVTIHGPDEFNDVVGFHLAEKVACCRFLSAISHYAVSQIMKASEPKWWSKAHVSPLGVDPCRFAPRRLRAARQTFECLTVGRLAPAKGHHILIAAVDRLVAQGRTNIRLTVVGEGPLRASLEEAITARRLGEYVRLAGAINHDRILEFYERADVFALPSFAEGVPVVLMEAMAMEIPCIATWITGVPELIRAGVDGILIRPADPEALAAAIARLMDEPELGLKLGQSARQRVIECYDLERNTERLARTFDCYMGGEGGKQ